MSKLIYSPTSALAESVYSGIKNGDLTINQVYRSIAITGDGFMYTHGKKFRLFNVVDGAAQGLTFSITDGLANVFIDGTAVGVGGTVVQSVTGDSVVTATTSKGAVTIAHAETLLAENTFGSATQVPIITVNKSGHITAISNSTTIDISKIKASATTTTGTYYIPGVTGNTLLNPVYQTKFYFDGSGNVHANNLYIGNNQLSDLFAPTSHTSVYATASAYGHVKLHDTADNDKDASSHWAATPKAVAAAIATANQYAEDLFASQDAMIFVGTVNASGVIQAHNSAVVPNVTDGTTNLTTLPYKTGWTLRFTSAGTFQGESVEIGDMIIAVNNKGNDFAISDWTIIQANLDGTLSSASNLTGVLYGTGSRTISALAFDNGKVLTSTSNGLAFVNKNTLWRTIKVNNASIGTNNFEIVSGTNIGFTTTNGKVTIAVDNAGVIATASSLTIKDSDTTFTYSPSSAATLNVGSLLSLSESNGTYTISHAAGTAFTNKFGSITTDSYGHITGITDVTTLPNPSSFIIKKGNDSLLSYSGSAERTLILADGTDVSFGTSTSAGTLTITPSITHKYRPISYKATSAVASATSILADSVSTAITFIGGTNVTLSSTTAGTLTISAEDTWRDIQAYKFTSNTFSRSSIGNGALNFGNDFLFADNEISIVWTEIDDEGRVTYVK